MSRRKLLLANNPLLAGPKLADRDQGGIPYRDLLVDLIESDPHQPRRHFDEAGLQELAESVRQYGILTPILVRPEGTTGRYVIIAGERRYRAARIAGLVTVPAIVDQGESRAGDRTLAIQLVENLQRADLSALERAHAIGTLKDSFGLSVREVGEKLGVSKSMVQRSLDLLSLPDDLLHALREGASESKILLLAKIEDEDIRATYLKDLELVTRQQLQKEVLDRKTDSTTSTAPSARATSRLTSVSAEDERLSDEIQRALGLKVRLQRTDSRSRSGRLTIEFYSDADLQEVFRKLVSDTM
jgi:ParB family chromosome partitioning protein